MTPKTKSTEPSEAEIVFARASVALAKTQRLVASWLPQKSAEELAREKDGNADGDEDDWEGEGELGYELLGVGATPPSKDASGNLPKRKDPSLEALRKQLMGRNAPKQAAAGHRPAPPSAASVGKSQALPRRPGRDARKADASESEDEGGRGGAFVSKNGGWKKKAKVDVKGGGEEEGAMEVALNAGNEDADVTMVDPAKKTPPESAPKKRKATSFMDEILAEKSAKKKKKKNKGKGESTNDQ